MIPRKSDDVSRAAMSIAKMVDEYTARRWNDEGLGNFARIVERRLRRFIRPSQSPAIRGEKT